MKTSIFSSTLFLLRLFILTMGLQNCKKTEEPVVDPYAFLNGKWRYSNGAEAVFNAATKSAKGTKVPDNNTQFKFVVGEDYWRNVASIGTDAWSYDQIVRFSDGKTVEYRKSTMKKKDANSLLINTPNLTDTELTRVP